MSWFIPRVVFPNSTARGQCRGGHNYVFVIYANDQRLFEEEETVQLKIKSPEDLWSGIIFIGIGVLAMYLSRDYPMGSALRMGPGYFPTWLGGIMIGFGLVIAALSLKMQLQSAEEDEPQPWGFRPWLVLSGSFVVFGLMMDYIEAGFVPSLMVLITGCALAHKDVHWWETILLAIFVPVAAVG